MHNSPDRDDGPLRVGPLFSGRGGLDLAVEHVFSAETIWFSELNETVARIFGRHWPDAPNLGDITAMDRRAAAPVDILTGVFPCQFVLTVGQRAGLTPCAASGLWSNMAAAFAALQPKLVVIENVRGLLSTTAAQRATLEGTGHERRNPDNATSATDAASTLRDVEPDPWHVGDDATRPLRAAGAVLGDLADLRRDTRWIGLPASLVGASHHRFRIFILAHPQGPVPNPAGLRLLPSRRVSRTGAGQPGHDRAVAPDHRPCPARTRWLTEQAQRVRGPVDADQGHLRRWGRYADAIGRWEPRTSPGTVCTHRSHLDG
ncbi:C-5 cytosine-specific DNA methylase [Beutenbergia cavernae DSM 12333]|uniref:C-5 cytosine-specific DNA methylase n=1 Tax=Beutenbergia cavernae (strain ATCC BAA-8 / DSM 12333 / CCUG 43141 / JCM 11478 / NBRC 16432 / NCIMB 13614 / HKI 0122) TaxID=471853 RepID=C5C6I6_BEUC1|nr:C-5 cytosine-specific DNA methylase [Beutenbergia cavernae DSM 12333]